MTLMECAVDDAVTFATFSWGIEGVLQTTRYLRQSLGKTAQYSNLQLASTLNLMTTPKATPPVTLKVWLSVHAGLTSGNNKRATSAYVATSASPCILAQPWVLHRSVLQLLISVTPIAMPGGNLECSSILFWKAESESKNLKMFGSRCNHQDLPLQSVIIILIR